MIRVFTGSDRVKAQAEIRKWLGADYEVVEGSEVTPAMMPSVFMGMSLFGEARKIVIRDLGESKESLERLVDYVGTQHQVVVWESKLDKRLKIYKDLVAAGIEVKEFELPKFDGRKVFNIYTTALADGKKALAMLAEVQDSEEPQALVGLFTTQALRGFTGRPRERRIVKALAELDMQMKNKSAAGNPWHLVKSFLLRLSQI